MRRMTPIDGGHTANLYPWEQVVALFWPWRYAVCVVYEWHHSEPTWYLLMHFHSRWLAKLCFRGLELALLKGLWRPVGWAERRSIRGFDVALARTGTPIWSRRNACRSAQ